MIKLVPGFDDECIIALVTHSTTLRALVLELYGTGNEEIPMIMVIIFEDDVVLFVDDCVQ